LNNFLYDLGIGCALAKEFLKAGDNVLICSRSGVDKQTLAISICFNFAIYLFHAIYLWLGFQSYLSDFYGFVFLSKCLGTHLKMKG
jgi:hypothetical protein